MRLTAAVSIDRSVKTPVPVQQLCPWSGPRPEPSAAEGVPDAARPRAYP